MLEKGKACADNNKYMGNNVAELGKAVQDRPEPQP
jgi:hypothetical protein